MKTSFVVLVLLGAVDLQSRHAAVHGAQLERYFPHHSWERVNPAEFVRNLNQEVEAEKQQKKKGAAANALNQKQQKNQKKDDSMIQQEQDEGQFTAHEMAIQLKETMQSTLAEMGVDYKTHDDAQNDLVQVTADDFDNYDHLNENNRGHPKTALNGDEKDELNKQKVAHIARMEQKLTERINTLLNSGHRTDSDEGELEDVLLEVKPIKKLNEKLAQAHEKMKDASEVKKSHMQTFSQLDDAFEGLKGLVDKRKQMLAQFKEQRRHHHHPRRDAEEERELREAAPRDFVPRHAAKLAPRTHMSQQIDMDKFQQKFGDKAGERTVKMQEHFKAAAPRPEQMERRMAPQPVQHAAPMPPRSEPMQQPAEGYVKPHGIPDPRDRFAMPSNELRQEKKAELDKLDEEAGQDKADKELATITRGAKSIIDYNKKQLRDVEQKFNKQERKDILTRQDTHKKIKKLNKHDKMEKELSEEQEVENTIKRADQITAAVKDYENKQFSKDVVADAEDDMITKEDQANAKLEKQFKKELEKEDRHSKKKHLKEQEERGRLGYDRPDKFVYPEDAKKMAGKVQNIQEPASLVEQSTKVEKDDDEDEKDDNKSEEKEEEKGESEDKSDEKEKSSSDEDSKESSEDKSSSDEDKSEEAPAETEKPAKKNQPAAKSAPKQKPASISQKKSSKKAVEAESAADDDNDSKDEAQEKEFNSFAQHAMDALSEAKKLEAEFDDLQKDD